VGCDVRPTTDTATALQNFEEEGFCILKGVLTADEVTMYRDHLHSVMGDLNFLDEEGRRRDPATATFTEPSVTPPRSERSYTLISNEVGEAHFNAGLGQHWHNGDFGGRYGDELRLMVEGYVRHDPRWAATGCENERVRAVIEPLLGDDFRVVYTDGALDFPGASALGWHADGPTLSFNGRIVDASPRITSLWMLSDFTAENGCAMPTPAAFLPPYATLLSRVRVSSVAVRTSCLAATRCGSRGAAAATAGRRRSAPRSLRRLSPPLDRLAMS
jgi:hypothetical protein